VTRRRTAAPAAGPGARPRRRLPPGPLWLVAALVAAAVLLWLPAPAPPGPPGPLTLADAWPGVSPGALPASVPDGPAYHPVYLLDPRTSVGTAPSPDGARLRLLLRTADATPRQLRSLPLDRDPQFGGVTAQGDDLVWAESQTAGAGEATTSIWSLRWREPGAVPRRLVADAGQVAFFNSEYDLQVAQGRVHWVAVAPVQESVTELRSVALGGGAVAVRAEPGAWARAAWPWLVSAVTEVTGEVQLWDPVARKRRAVPASADDLVTCGAAWCRVQVVGGDGPSGLDLMRPDGTQRRRIAGVAETAALVDVAVLDRFEPLVRDGAGGDPTSSQDLLLYDAQRDRAVHLAAGVGTVASRAGYLWWSTGGPDDIRWHVLDLRALT